MIGQLDTALFSGILNVYAPHAKRLVHRFLEVSESATMLRLLESNPKEEDWLDGWLGKAPEMEIVDGVAIIPIRGSIARGVPPKLARWLGISDVDITLEQVAMAADSLEIERVLFDVSSPGGVASGVQELTEEVAKLTAQKPTMAFCDGLCASAAYHAIAPVKKVVAPPDSIVGSIGTFMVLWDLSGFNEKWGVKAVVITNEHGKYKAAGVAGTALTDPQKEQLEEMVNDLHLNFRRQRHKVENGR